MSSQSGMTDPLETSLMQGEQKELCEEAEGYVKWMDPFEPKEGTTSLWERIHKN